LNRRRFLKYAGATAAVVGASALGLDYISEPSPPTVIPITSTTMTHALTTTSAFSSTSSQVVELASLNGRLFFDYSGDGKQDAGEPHVAGALVQLKDNAGSVIAETLTDSSGDYKLEDIRTGTYRLHLGVDHFSDEFRYMCSSPDEFRTVTDDYLVPLQKSVRMDIGLMEGFLTLPFRKGTVITRQYSFFDLDPRLGFVRDWRDGNPVEGPNNGVTMDGHIGVDYGLREGTEITAAAPGVVSLVQDGWPDNPEIEGQGNTLFIWHDDQFTTRYCHLSKVLVATRQAVRRGDVVALSGNTGTESGAPHLHFQLNQYSRTPVDPYSYWTIANKPQYPA